MFQVSDQVGVGNTIVLWLENLNFYFFSSVPFSSVPL